VYGGPPNRQVRRADDGRAIEVDSQKHDAAARRFSLRSRHGKVACGGADKDVDPHGRSGLNTEDIVATGRSEKGGVKQIAGRVEDRQEQIATAS